MGTWDPGHGHERVDRSACVYSDASHAMGPITYCGTQSHTHKTRHFHYGGNGCHPTADTHPTGTSPDTCEAWASDTRDALRTVNPDGTYNISPAPSGCGTSNQEILGYIKVLGDNAAREIRNILEDWRKSTRGVAELNKADREAAINEYKKAWNELPKPVRVAGEVTATYAGCAVLAGAAYAAVFRGKPAAGAKIAQHAAGLGCNIGFELIPLIDDSDPDGDNSDDDGSGDGSDADPEPTPDPNDPDGDGTTTAQEATEAAIKHQAGEITAAEYIRILRRYWCGNGDPSYTSYCNE